MPAANGKKQRIANAKSEADAKAKAKAKITIEAVKAAHVLQPMLGMLLGLAHRSEVAMTRPMVQDMLPSKKDEPRTPSHNAIRARLLQRWGWASL